MSYDAIQPEAQRFVDYADVGSDRFAYAEFSDDGRSAIFTLSLPDPVGSVAPKLTLGFETIESARDERPRVVLTSSDIGELEDQTALIDYALDKLVEMIGVGSAYVRTRDAGLISYLSSVYDANRMELVGEFGREPFQMLSLKAVEMVAQRSRETGVSRAIDAMGPER